MRRIGEWMRRYDQMDFADGSRVAAAETLGIQRVYTLDSHFYGYRTHDRDAFEVLP